MSVAIKTVSRRLVPVMAALTLGACATTYHDHGYVYDAPPPYYGTYGYYTNFYDYHGPIFGYGHDFVFVYDSPYRYRIVSRYDGVLLGFVIVEHGYRMRFVSPAGVLLYWGYYRPDGYYHFVDSHYRHMGVIDPHHRHYRSLHHFAKPKVRHYDHRDIEGDRHHMAREAGVRAPANDPSRGAWRDKDNRGGPPRDGFVPGPDRGQGQNRDADRRRERDRERFEDRRSQEDFYNAPSDVPGVDPERARGRSPRHDEENERKPRKTRTLRDTPAAPSAITPRSAPSSSREAPRGRRFEDSDRGRSAPAPEPRARRNAAPEPRPQQSAPPPRPRQSAPPPRPQQSAPPPRPHHAAPPPSPQQSAPAPQSQPSAPPPQSKPKKSRKKDDDDDNGKNKDKDRGHR